MGETGRVDVAAYRQALGDMLKDAQKAMRAAAAADPKDRKEGSVARLGSRIGLDSLMRILPKQGTPQSIPEHAPPCCMLSAFLLGKTHLFAGSAQSVCMLSNVNPSKTPSRLYIDFLRDIDNDTCSKMRKPPSKYEP